jgi:hypothetical protein
MSKQVLKQMEAGLAKLTDDEMWQLLSLVQTDLDKRTTKRPLTSAIASNPNEILRLRTENQQLQANLAREANISAGLRSTAEERATYFEQNLMKIINAQKECNDLLVGLCTYVQMPIPNYDKGLQHYCTELQQRVNNMTNMLNDIFPGWRTEEGIKSFVDNILNVLEMLKHNRQDELIAYSQKEEPLAYQVGGIVSSLVEAAEKHAGGRNPDKVLTVIVEMAVEMEPSYTVNSRVKWLDMANEIIKNLEAIAEPTDDQKEALKTLRNTDNRSEYLRNNVRSRKR